MAGALLTQLFTWIAPRVIPCLEVLYINHLYLHSTCNFLCTRIQRYLFFTYSIRTHAPIISVVVPIGPGFAIVLNLQTSLMLWILHLLHHIQEGNMIGPWQSKWVGKCTHCINHWISEQSTKLERNAEHILYPALNKSKRSEHIWHFRESNRLESFQIRTHLGDRATHWS